MDSRLKVAGHAVHPMLIPLPLGMFVATLIFDLVYLVTDDLQFATESFSMAALAAVGGVAAAATGAVDVKNIPKGTRAKRVVLPENAPGGGAALVREPPSELTKISGTDAAIAQAG